MSDYQTEQQPQEQTPAPAEQQQASSASDSELIGTPVVVKRLTGDRHWNTAKGIWETITHAETGEPSSEYALVIEVDGVEVTLDTYNAGGIETIVRSQQQAQQTPEA